MRTHQAQEVKRRRRLFRSLTRERAPLRPAVREAIWGYAFVSPWLVGLLGLILGPMLVAFGLSLFRTDFFTETRFVGLKWWSVLFVDRLYHRALLNTAYYVFVSVPLQTVLATLIAILLNQGLRGQGIWRTIYYLPSVVSGIAVAILWTWLFHPEVGLLNAMLASIGIKGPGWIYSEAWAMPSLIIMSLWAVGGSMLIYLAGLRAIPTSLYEAAEIDGAGTVKKFWYVTIPMLSPVILFNLVMGIIGAWQVFTQALIMTDGGPNNATLTVVLYVYRTGFQTGYFGYSSAQACGLFLIVLSFVYLGLRSSGRWVSYERV